MPEVIVYTTAICPYCIRAKTLLQRKGVDFTEVRVDLNHERMAEMMQRSQRRTVPQVFVGEVHIGGYDDMAALDQADELDPLLGLS